MENFLISYRDPIFGLIVLTSIILLVAVLSFFWGVFSKKDENHNIEKFIKKFDSTNTLSNKYDELLRHLEIGADVLAILASTFVKSGDFEKAISVYIIALSKTNDKKERVFLLTSLGKVYFKAGFLERAENVLLQSLKLSPRNPEALKILSVIYERLKFYDKALESIDALTEQGEETYALNCYIQALIIKNDRNLSFNEKISRILALNFDSAKRMALELYLQNKEPLENFKNFPELKNCIDLIYPLNFAVNTDDNEFKELFYTKNLTSQNGESQIFEINALSALKKTNFSDATLKFSYICQNCKSSLPTFFYRCPMCYSLQSVQIIPQITKKTDEISQTF